MAGHSSLRKIWYSSMLADDQDTWRHITQYSTAIYIFYIFLRWQNEHFINMIQSYSLLTHIKIKNQMCCLKLW